MATYEEAKAAVALSDRTDAELEQLFRLLEEEPGWQARAQAPEPLHTQLRQMEQSIIESRQAMAMSREASEMFNEDALDYEKQEALGILPTAGHEAAWAKMVHATQRKLVGSNAIREVTQNAISAFRVARGEAPLTGAETLLN